MEFFEAEAPSQHFLIMMADLSVHDRNRAIASYLDKKLACPDLTACFILPYGSQHARRLQNMQLIRKVFTVRRLSHTCYPLIGGKR